MMYIKQAWEYMLWQIYHTGESVFKDDAPIQEKIGMFYRIENPVLTASPFMVYSMSSPKFIDLIRRGVFDIKDYPLKGEALADYVDSINDWDKIDINRFHPEWLEDGEYNKPFVYTYPERLLMLWTSNTSGELEPVNQIEVMCERLKKNLGSNRAMAVLYQAGLDSKVDDIPCLQLIQAFVRNGELILSVYFRSNDIYGAFPSNMLFISNIGLMLQYELKQNGFDVTFKSIDYHVSSAHFYESDRDAVEAIVGDKEIFEFSR